MLVGVVVTGAVVIAAIGFAGSYAAVRELAVSKGFGWFAPFFPIGIDAGIVVLLALDLLLTWIRIPFPLLRQTAWLLTAATIAFNGAAAWPDPLGVGMHAVIPVLFVVSVEAARHAIGRIADITADRHMEGVRIARWLLAFPSTFRLWRRMKLWELRSYDQVIRMEQDRLVYEARLRARFGRGWRRKAPVEALMPLRLARYGVPLTETGPAGLASAGITEPLRPAAERPALPQPAAPSEPTRQERATEDIAAEPELGEEFGQPRAAEAPPATLQESGEAEIVPGREETAFPASAAQAVEESPTPTADAPAERAQAEEATPPETVVDHQDVPMAGAQLYAEAFEAFIAQHGDWPNARQFGLLLADMYGVTDPDTHGPLSEADLRPVLVELRARYPFTADGPGPGQSADADPLVANNAEADGAMAGPASSASDAGEVAAGDGTSPATHPLATATASVTAGGEAGPGSAGWDLPVDIGEATARLPEQQTTGPELSPEEQRIELVVQWLDEAEEPEKLSGAEVARRLGVAPRTGQRDLRKARERWSEEMRQQSRSRLRSVAASG